MSNSAVRSVPRYHRTGTIGVNVLLIPLSDVTNSKHKLREFSMFQTMY